MLVLFVTATVALFVDRANFSEWASFIEWTFAAYIAGNVGTKATYKVQSPKSSE